LAAKPLTLYEARALFAPWFAAPAIVLAVSGGPDSMALLWLAAKWRATRARAPRLVAVTIDHGLRAASAREAQAVKKAAAALGVVHRTLRWTGAKPATGIQAIAREARYRLLAKAAETAGASVVFTAHTSDDQAETLLMRMARGSGLAGLAGMARETRRGDLVIARPLLGIAKARLVAAVTKAGLNWVEDESNRDPRFTRARWRKLMPVLAAEGLDTRALGRLAGRLARANAALERDVDTAERVIVRPDVKVNGAVALDRAEFGALAEEIRLRLIARLVDRLGTEGPAELGKVEMLVADIDARMARPRAPRLRRTLAGAIVDVERECLRIGPAPARRGQSTRRTP
jgi:tRNA(Ile)-lysidine synthase